METKHLGYLFPDTIQADIWIDEHPESMKAIYVEQRIIDNVQRVFIGDGFQGGARVMPETPSRWIEISRRGLAGMSDNA